MKTKKIRQTIKRKIRLALMGSLPLLFILASLGSMSQNNVANTNLIQKRKYTKGYFIKPSSKETKSKHGKNEKLAQFKCKPVRTKEIRSDEPKTDQSNDNNNPTVSQEKTSDTNELVASKDGVTPKTILNEVQSLFRAKTNKKVTENSDKSYFPNNNALNRKINKIINRPSIVKNSHGNDAHVEVLGLVGMIVTAGCFFPGILIYFLGIIAGLFGIIMGAISLVKIKKNPDKFKGKGFGITSIILGVLIIAIALTLVALVAATL